METRRFGNTDMQVTVLGFGGGEIGSAEDDAAVERLLNQVLDAGVNVIDTASCYGRSEERIGKAVGHRRDEFHLFSKCGHAKDLDPAEWTPEVIEQSVERSLKRLRTDHLDLLQLHSCGEETLRQGDVIEAINKAREAGKTRYVGYSGDGPAARFALRTGAFDTLQTSLNIADQEGIDLTLPLARDRNVGVIVKRPIANAAWLHAERPAHEYVQPYWERLRELDYPFLRDEPREAIGVALRFVLATLGVHTAIVGTTNPEHFADNRKGVDAGLLPREQYEAIRSRWQEAADQDWAGRT